MPNHHLFPNTRYVIHNNIQECGTWSEECRIGGYLEDMHRNGVIRVGTGSAIPVNPKRKKKITLPHVDPMSREPSSDNHGSHTPHRHVLQQAQQTRSTQSHIKVIFS